MVRILHKSCKLFVPFDLFWRNSRSFQRSEKRNISGRQLRERQLLQHRTISGGFLPDLQVSDEFWFAVVPGLQQRIWLYLSSGLFGSENIFRIFDCQRKLYIFWIPKNSNYNHFISMFTVIIIIIKTRLAWASCICGVCLKWSKSVVIKELKGLKEGRR